MTESFIFQHSKTKESTLKSQFFSTIKNYDFIDENNNPCLIDENDPRVMAKAKLKNNNSYKYMIRLDNLKKIYDPTIDMSETKDKNLFNVDGSEIEFKEVSKPTFDLYLSFLKTMNVAWIRNAEREDF
jgi:hypothetical protein